MQRTPPRHLAPPARTRPRARDHLLAESILALAAIGITTVILVGSLLDRPESSAARLPNLLPPAPTTTRAAATTPSPASTRPAAPPDDGNLLAEVARLKKGQRYEAAVWFRASRPGVEVEVNLYELRGGRRFAVDTLGAVARSGSWQQL